MTAFLAYARAADLFSKPFHSPDPLAPLLYSVEERCCALNPRAILPLKKLVLELGYTLNSHEASVAVSS